MGIQHLVEDAVSVDHIKRLSEINDSDLYAYKDTASLYTSDVAVEGKI